MMAQRVSALIFCTDRQAIGISCAGCEYFALIERPKAAFFVEAACTQLIVILSIIVDIVDQ